MIIRKKLESNYTKIPNTPDDYLNDPTISAKSKGILTQLLSKPDTWTLNVSYLVKTNKDGASAIRTAINELIGSGYIHREVTRDKSGRIRGTQHVIFDRRVSPAEVGDILRSQTVMSQKASVADVGTVFEVAKCDVTKSTAKLAVTDCDRESKDIPSGVGDILKSQNATLKQDTTASVSNSNVSSETQIRYTAPNATDRMRKIHIRKIDPVVSNKGINKLKGVTTTTPEPEQEPVIESPLPSQSYPATEDINFLLNLIPEQHRQPMVISLVNQSAKKYTALEMEEAIVYASANVKGGWPQYKAYLDKTLKGKWAAGYLETIGTTTPAVLSPGGFTGAVPAGRYPNQSVTGCVRMDSNYMAAAQFLTEMGLDV